MRLAVAATPTVAIPTLEFLLDSEHQLVRVFTTGDKAVGRGRVVRQSDVAFWADEHHVECIKVSHATDLTHHLEDVDCVVTIAFGLLLPAQILTIPTHGFINLHFSLLPAWRGAAPVQRAIESGDEELGISVFALEAGMDTGPIYAQSSFPRDSRMRSKEALEYLGVQGVALIAKTLEDISQSIAPVAQREVGVSLARKLSKEEALVTWDLPAEAINRKIAAFYPNPIAHTSFRGEIIKLTESQMSDDLITDLSLTPGELFVEKERVFIGTATIPLQIMQLIPQGKSEMKASDWARGARVNAGERCG